MSFLLDHADLFRILPEVVLTLTGVTVMLWWARCTATTCVTGVAAP